MRALLGLSIVLLAACGPRTPETCPDEDKIALQSPDGCNDCFVCAGAFLGDAECTALACLPPQVPASEDYICVEQPCVDNRGVASFIPECSAGPVEVGGTIPECEGEGDAVPEGADACLDLRYGESLGSDCASAGYVVEYRIRLAAGGAYDESSLFSVLCTAPDYFDWANGAEPCYGPGPQQID